MVPKMSSEEFCDTEQLCGFCRFCKCVSYSKQGYWPLLVRVAKSMSSSMTSVFDRYVHLSHKDMEIQFDRCRLSKSPK